MLYNAACAISTRNIRSLIACVPRSVPTSLLRGPTKPWQSLVSTPLRYISTKVCCRNDPTQEDCYWEYSRKRTAQRASKLNDLGAENAFPKYNPLKWSHVDILETWYASGPPPLSEYKLTFGKHRGKKLDGVPDTYLVKYLIARHGKLDECPMINEAVRDFMERHPDVKSQAGKKKTRLREGGIATPVRKPRGRPRKVGVAPRPDVSA